MAWANRDPDPATRRWDPMLPPRETDANEDQESTVPDAAKKHSFLWGARDESSLKLVPWDQRYAGRDPAVESRMEEIDLRTGSPFEFADTDKESTRPGSV